MTDHPDEIDAEDDPLVYAKALVGSLGGIAAQLSTIAEIPQETINIHSEQTGLDDKIIKWRFMFIGAMLYSVVGHPKGRKQTMAFFMIADAIFEIMHYEDQCDDFMGNCLKQVLSEQKVN